MRIARVETRQFSLKEGTSILVFLYTDNGMMGVGETFSANRPETLCAALEEVKPKILGFDPLNVNAVGAMLGSVSDEAFSNVSLQVMCGVEAACLDIVGKQLGVPVSQLFGGSLRDELRMCATGWEQFDDTPEDYGRRAREICGAGFTAIKFDPFGHADALIGGSLLERAVTITCKVREAVGRDVDLIADANARFTPSEAIRVAEALETFGLMWLEDPIEASELDSLASVAGAVKVPLCVGKRLIANHSFREVIERQLIDFVQPDCQNVGGMSRLRSIAWLAESYYMSVALHQSGGPVALAMNMHVAACASNLAVVEVPYPIPSWWTEAVKMPFEQKRGTLKVPVDSGLGIEFCEALLDSASHPPSNSFALQSRRNWRLMPEESHCEWKGELVLQSAIRRDLLIACVRKYFEACNEADREKMYSCFSADAAHYFPPGVGGPYVGKKSIADLWINSVHVNGSLWTIDRIVADDIGVAIEWTHFKPRLDEFIRGAEWYEFDKNGLMTAIRAYYASPRDNQRKHNELEGFPYATQGFSLVPPNRACEPRE